MDTGTYFEQDSGLPSSMKLDPKDERLLELSTKLGRFQASNHCLRGENSKLHDKKNDLEKKLRLCREQNDSLYSQAGEMKETIELLHNKVHSLKQELSFHLEDAPDEENTKEEEHTNAK